MTGRLPDSGDDLPPPRDPSPWEKVTDTGVVTPESSSPRRGIVAILAVIVSIGAFLFFFGSQFFNLGLGQILFVSFWIGFGLYLLVGLITDPGRQSGSFARAALIWLLIASVIGTGHVFRRELGGFGDRIAANLGAAQGQGYALDQGLAFERAQDGHYYVAAEINDQRIVFLVDTGASAVVLSPADASRLGIEVSQRDFTGVAVTANGEIPVAPVTLDQVSVGPIAISNVRALDRKSVV